ncbi:MAG: hypothetical protein U9Q15_02150 [Patescibacteria group bacterium]|nr:hypothetical protein [Patescibacteria group bacterium]
MQKDFQTWCHVKDQKNSLKDIPYFYQREIWFVSCGVNIGFEQDGK